MEAFSEPCLAVFRGTGMGNQFLMHHSLVLEVILFYHVFSNIFNPYCSRLEECSLMTPSLAQLRAGAVTESREAGTDSIDHKALKIKAILSSLCSIEKKNKVLGPGFMLSSLGEQRSYTRQTLR